MKSVAISEPPGYLQLFYRTCEGLGHPRADGDTLQNHLKRIQDAGLCIPFADELLTYHYAVTYRECPRDKGLEKRMLKSIKSLGNF